MRTKTPALEKSIQTAIAAKEEERKTLQTELAAAEQSLAEKKEQLKICRTRRKAVEKELSHLAEQQAAELEQQKKADVENALQKLLDEGFSAEDILELLAE